MLTELTNVVKWFWIDGSTSNVFEDVNNMKVENAYKNTEAKITLTDNAKNEDFEVDLQQMQMLYVEQPKQVYSVIRRDLIAGRLNKYFTLSKVICYRCYRMSVNSFPPVDTF